MEEISIVILNAQRTFSNVPNVTHKNVQSTDVNKRKKNYKWFVLLVG